jgi:hypothetical protein
MDFTGTALVDHHGFGNRDHQAERHKILLRVVGQVGERHRIDRHRAVVGDEQRVAVGRRLLHGFGAEPHRGAGAVLDDHRLAPLGLHLFGDDARRDVDRAARRGRHDDFHRAVGIALRAGHGCREAECESDRERSLRAHVIPPSIALNRRP